MHCFDIPVRRRQRIVLRVQEKCYQRKTAQPYRYALDLRRGIAPRAGGSFGAEEPPWRRSTALAQDVQTADAYGVLRAEPLPRLRLRRKHALLLVVSPFRLATSESVLSSQSSPLDTRAILACLIRRLALAIFFDTAVSCFGPGPRKDLSLQHSQTA